MSSIPSSVVRNTLAILLIVTKGEPCSDKTIDAAIKDDDSSVEEVISSRLEAEAGAWSAISERFEEVMVEARWWLLQPHRSYDIPQYILLSLLRFCFIMLSPNSLVSRVGASGLKKHAELKLLLISSSTATFCIERLTGSTTLSLDDNGRGNVTSQVGLDSRQVFDVLVDFTNSFTTSAIAAYASSQSSSNDSFYRFIQFNQSANFLKLLKVLCLGVASTSSSCPPRKRYETCIARLLGPLVQLMELLAQDPMHAIECTIAVNKKAHILSPATGGNDKMNRKRKRQLTHESNTFSYIFSHLVECCLFGVDGDNVYDEIYSLSIRERGGVKRDVAESSNNVVKSTNNQKTNTGNSVTSYFASFFLCIKNVYKTMATNRSLQLQNCEDVPSDVNKCLDGMTNLGCALASLFLTFSKSLRKSMESRHVKGDQHDQFLLLKNRKICSRLLHFCLLLFQYLDSEGVVTNQDSQSNDNDNDNDNDNKSVSTSSKKRQRQTNSNSNNGNDIFATLCTLRAKYQILKALQTELRSVCGNIPNHDSLQVYVNALISLCENYVMESMKVDIVDSTSTLYVATLLGCVQTLINIDHRVVTEKTQTSQYIVFSIARAERYIKKCTNNHSGSSLFLGHMCEQLILGVIDLHSDLRKMDELASAIITETPPLNEKNMGGGRE